MIPRHPFLMRVLQLLGVFVSSLVVLGVSIGIEPTKEVGGGTLGVSHRGKEGDGVVAMPVRRIDIADGSIELALHA